MDLDKALGASQRLSPPDGGDVAATSGLRGTAPPVPYCRARARRGRDRSGAAASFPGARRPAPPRPAPPSARAASALGRAPASASAFRAPLGRRHPSRTATRWWLRTAPACFPSSRTCEQSPWLRARAWLQAQWRAPPRARKPARLLESPSLKAASESAPPRAVATCTCERVRHRRSTWQAYITTGAPVPEGADAVVQVEDTAAAPPSPRGTRRVEIRKAAAPAQDIRPVGSDVSQGEARPPNLPDRTHVVQPPAVPLRLRLAPRLRPRGTARVRHAAGATSGLAAGPRGAGAARLLRNHSRARAPPASGGAYVHRRRAGGGRHGAGCAAVRPSARLQPYHASRGCVKPRCALAAQPAVGRHRAAASPPQPLLRQDAPAWIWASSRTAPPHWSRRSTLRWRRVRTEPLPRPPRRASPPPLSR